MLLLVMAFHAIHQISAFLEAEGQAVILLIIAWAHLATLVLAIAAVEETEAAVLTPRLAPPPLAHQPTSSAPIPAFSAHRTKFSLLGITPIRTAIHRFLLGFNWMTIQVLIQC